MSHLAERTKKILRIISWTVTAGVFVMIFLFSCQNGTESATVSNSVTDLVAEQGLKTADETAYQELDTLIRKAAHMAEFALLAASAACAFQFTDVRHPVHHALIFAILTAALDEFHQLFVAGRAALLSDVVVDTVGACVGLFCFCLVRHLVLTHKRNGEN